MNNNSLLRSMKICEYFNDIGLVNHNNVNLFLNIYSEIVKKRYCKNKNEILQYSLYTFMKLISRDDNQLHEYSKRTINAFNNNQLISKYKSIKIIKTVLYLKLKKLLTNFLFQLIRNKSNKRKNNFRNSKKKSKSIKLIKHDTDNLNNYNKDSLKTSYNNSLLNYSIINDEKECTFSPKINKNFKPYYEREQIKTISYTPSLKVSTNIPKKGIPNIMYNTQKQIYKNNLNPILNSNNMNSMNNFWINPLMSPILYHRNINNKIPNEDNYNSNSLDLQNYNFYKNETNHINKVNDKLLNLKMKRINDIEKDCTFIPETNKNYKIKKQNLIPRYIQLHNDAKNRQNNYEKLRDKYLKEETSQSIKTEHPNNNYYKKLYNDALYYKEKEIENEKREKGKYSFSPEIYKNNKYIVKMPFNERRAKSIENKKKFLQKKEEKEKKELEDMKKNNVSKNKNINNKDVIDRLYSKGYEKIKEKIEKEKKEKEEKNKVKQIINWDKINNENNIKNSEMKKNEHLKNEEPIKMISNNGEKETKIENNKKLEEIISSNEVKEDSNKK